MYKLLIVFALASLGFATTGCVPQTRHDRMSTRLSRSEEAGRKIVVQARQCRKRSTGLSAELAQVREALADVKKQYSRYRRTTSKKMKDLTFRVTLNSGLASSLSTKLHRAERLLVLQKKAAALPPRVRRVRRCKSDKDCTLYCAKPRSCCHRVCGCKTVMTTAMANKRIRRAMTWRKRRCQARPCPRTRCPPSRTTYSARCALNTCVLEANRRQTALEGLFD